jgi:hypothetical protein
MVSLCLVGFQCFPLNHFRSTSTTSPNRPHEISIMMSPLADVVKITNIARMAHKYHFANIEIWALDALARLLQREDPDPIEIPSLILATEVVVLCDDAKLLQIISPKWKSLIEKNKDLSLAINVFERLGMRDLNGLAYHAMMLQGRKKWNSDPLLTREQRICLLSGYYEIFLCSWRMSKFLGSFLEGHFDSDFKSYDQHAGW